MNTETQIRQGAIRNALYRPERRELYANIKWSLESADARDEIRQAIDHKRYVNRLPKQKDYYATIKWCLESSDAQDEVRETYNLRDGKAFSNPSHLRHHLAYLPAPQLTFSYGYGYLSSDSLRYYVSAPPPAEEPHEEPTPSTSKSPELKRHVVDKVQDRPRYTLPPGPYSDKEPDSSMQALIGQALATAEEGALTLREIYAWVSTVYPFYTIPTEKDQNGRYEAIWMKKLWRILSSSYFERIPRDKGSGRPYNLYRIRTEDASCFEGGDFQRRKVTTRKRKRAVVDEGPKAKAKKRPRRMRKAAVAEDDTMSTGVDTDLAEDDVDEQAIDTERDFSDEEDQLSESEYLPFPPAPNVEPRYVGRSTPPPPRSFPPPPRTILPPPGHSHQPVTQRLIPSQSLPTSLTPCTPLQKLGPVHSWHEPLNLRTMVATKDLGSQ